MTTIYLKEQEMQTRGDFLSDESVLFSDIPLTKTDLSTVSFRDYNKQGLLINVYPSIDTSVCFDSVINFQKKLEHETNTKLICVSMDLPFALRRLQDGEPGLENITFLSDFRNREFGDRLGLTIIDGPLAGLLARAVIVLNADHKVIHKELVTDISNPPDYEAALKTIL